MPMNPKLTRGYLNNNPGNIDRGPKPWNGEIRDVSKCVNDVQRKELTQGRFCVFTSATYGIRAIALNLRSYRNRLGCKSVQDYINRWAPPNENNTAGYIDRVSMEIGVNPLAQIDIDRQPTMKALVKGIINVECAGMPYEDREIDAGLAAAGLPSPSLPPVPAPDVKPPSSKSVIAGTVTVAAGAGSVAEQLDQIQPTIDAIATFGMSLQSILKLGALALSIVALGAGAYMLWRYLSKRKRGEVIST